MTNISAIALIFLCTLLAMLLASWNSHTKRQNIELFQATGTLKAPRWQVLVFFALASFGTLMAVATSHPGDKEGTWPMALFGLLAMLFAWGRTFLTLSLEEDGLHYGWKGRRYIAYSDIAKLERRSDGRDAVFKVVLRSGKRIRIGTDISCEDLFIRQIQQRSGCEVMRYYGGRPVQNQ